MTLITLRKWNKYIQCQEAFYTPLLGEALQNIEQLMQNPLRLLKSDSTSLVVVVQLGSQRFVIKRANTKSIMHCFRRLFLPSRARKNWQNAQKLLNLKVNTFSPVALVEERIGPLRGRSYFICTYIEGLPALAYFADEAKRFFWPLAAKKLYNLSEQLAHNWVSHRDLNLSNIIFVNDDPWLVDLDAMREHASPWFAAHGAKRERQRFLQNCLETPGVLPEINQILGAVFSD